MNLQENIRRILREVFDSNSTFKRNVYGGEEEYREITKNRTVIWNPEYKISFQYIFDDEEVPGYTFVHLYPYSEDGYYYRWDTLENSIKSKIFIDAIKKLPKVLKNYFKKFGKVDNIVFRPKTEQMGNIYSSPSVIRHLESEFGSDYTIEVNTEESSHLPFNTVIMRLKNVEDSINESIKRIISEESKNKIAFQKLINFNFEGFYDIYYDWANYNCGMGICCDPYAIGFTLPKKDYDDYLFKLVDSRYYDDDGNYPKELSEDLPEVCYESPDVRNPNFDTIVFNEYNYEDNIEDIETFFGSKINWDWYLLEIINENFGCEATKIIFI